MTDHQIQTTANKQAIQIMGLQAHPCNNKRTFEGLEEPAGRAQHHHYQQQHNAARSAKQQCTIRVGVEAPDHLTAATNTAMPSCTETWYREQPQPQQQQHTAYDTYVNGFNAAEGRASTPFTAEASASPPLASTATAYVETASLSDYVFVSSSGSEVYSNQSIYQNLASMVPPAESLSDRFERVCSSPRPYVQDQYNYGAGSSASTTATTTTSLTINETKAEERYWTFGYSSNCPKKSSSYNSKQTSYGYNESSFKTSNGYQQIQRDENGKSYLELGAKAAFQPEWRPSWSAPVSNTPPQQQQHYNTSPAVKSCTKCGHVLSSSQHQRSPLPVQPCYRHQRLSVLSLSMLKLNRYRQCSDPSLHRSVLICNTLRHIEDEMEREGLVCNPATESSASTSSATAGAAGALSSCDTCCCSHCGNVFSSSSSASSPPAPASAPKLENNASGNGNTSRNQPAVYEAQPPESGFSTSVANADEDDSGFGDEDSRDIDWSSVFSMSTTSAFDVSASTNPAVSPSSAYMCSESNSSDPSFFAGSPDLMNDSVNSWKSNNSSSWTTNSDASDFTGVRWKSDLGDELEGFVHILVGS